MYAKLRAIAKYRNQVTDHLLFTSHKAFLKNKKGSGTSLHALFFTFFLRKMFLVV